MRFKHDNGSLFQPRPAAKVIFTYKVERAATLSRLHTGNPKLWTRILASQRNSSFPIICFSSFFHTSSTLSMIFYPQHINYCHVTCCYFMKIWSQFTDCPSPVDAENLSRKVGSGNYEIQKQSLVEQREAASLLDLSEEGIHHTYPYDTVY